MTSGRFTGGRVLHPGGSGGRVWLLAG